MKAYLVDDEALALARLERLLKADGRVEVIGSSTDPADALREIRRTAPELLFLDIQMPEMSGFDLLSRLDPQPLVIFATAYDRYALEAFRVNSIDYLLKPVEAAQLARALGKIERIRGGMAAPPDWGELLRKLTSLASAGRTPQYPERIASRVGEKVVFVETARVTHFFARDKLTYAATEAREHAVDATIQELEEKLDPGRFVRVHRSTILNLDYVHELHAWFGGRMMARLKDSKQTQITVARDRVKTLKERLGVA